MENKAGREPGTWSHDVPNQSPGLIVISVLFLLVTTVFFALRVKERWKRRPHESNAFSSTGTKRLLDELRQFCRYVLSDDVMAAAAYTTLVVETIFGGLAAHYGFGKHRADVLNTFPTAMLYFYLYQICYKILGGFTKLTFCSLYLKAFVYKNPDGWYQTHFKNLVLVTATVVGAGTFAFTVATIFQCTPVNRAWDRRVSGHCTDNLAFWFSHAAFNTVMDIAVFVLPLPVIHHIAAARKIRIGLMSTFALGAFVIAASIARMVSLKGSASSTSDPTWGSMPALIWTEIEANTAVIVCCCPALPALVKQLWRKTRKMVGKSVSLDSGSPKLPSNQNPASPHARESSRISKIYTFIVDDLPDCWRVIARRPRRSTGTHLPQDQYHTYSAGNFSWAHSGNHDRTLANTSGDEELAVLPPVSRLAPKLQYGGIFKKNTEAEPEEQMSRQRDVEITTRRQSKIEDPDEDRAKAAAFTKQDMERQNHQERRLERHLGNQM